MIRFASDIPVCMYCLNVEKVPVVNLIVNVYTT